MVTVPPAARYLCAVVIYTRLSAVYIILCSVAVLCNNPTTIPMKYLYK